MKNKLLILSLFIIALITFGCTSSEDDSESELFKEGGPFKFSELAGNWEGTNTLFFRPFSNSAEAKIVEDGGSVSLTVQSNGKCTFIIDPFDCEAYTESGEMFWELNDEEYYLEIVWNDFPDEGSSFWAELTDTTFNLWCGPEECVEYDFNCDGTPESATLSFRFIRE